MPTTNARLQPKPRLQRPSSILSDFRRTPAGSCRCDLFSDLSLLYLLLKSSTTDSVLHHCGIQDEKGFTDTRRVVLGIVHKRGDRLSPSGSGRAATPSGGVRAGQGGERLVPVSGEEQPLQLLPKASTLCQRREHGIKRRGVDLQRPGRRGTRPMAGAGGCRRVPEDPPCDSQPDVLAPTDVSPRLGDQNTISRRRPSRVPARARSCV